MVATFRPPYTTPAAVPAMLRERGHAVLAPDDVAELTGVDLPSLDALLPSWADLPLDTYMRDGGSYRRRRHSCFVVDPALAQRAPHRAHWQPVDYNALHGGMQRMFEPISEAVAAAPAWSRLLTALAACFNHVRKTQPWYVEAHQFRIDASDGIGRPTPEGAHRDGVDFVAVFLVGRSGIKGGETRVFEADGPAGQRFTLAAPWSLMLLDDTRMIHESTPIQPLRPGDADAHRDTLVLTYRREGFQGDASADTAAPSHATPGDAVTGDAPLHGNT